MFATKSIDAETRVLADAIQASSAVLAGKCSTIVRVGQAIAAFVAFGAKTNVRSVGILTCGSVTTR
jgi:hypothetical protein